MTTLQEALQTNAKQTRMRVEVYNPPSVEEPEQLPAENTEEQPITQAFSSV